MKLTKREIEFFSNPHTLLPIWFIWFVYTIPASLMFILSIWRNDIVGFWMGLIVFLSTGYSCNYFVGVYYEAKRLKINVDITH